MTYSTALLWLLMPAPPASGWWGRLPGGGFRYPMVTFQGVSATASFHSSPRQSHGKLCGHP